MQPLHTQRCHQCLRSCAECKQQPILVLYHVQLVDVEFLEAASACSEESQVLCRPPQWPDHVAKQPASTVTKVLSMQVCSIAARSPETALRGLQGLWSCASCHNHSTAGWSRISGSKGLCHDLIPSHTFHARSPKTSLGLAIFLHFVDVNTTQLTTAEPTSTPDSSSLLCPRLASG